MLFPKLFARSPRRDDPPTRRRGRLQIEELEDRVQPANLSLTSAYLSDVEGNKITTAAVGTVVYLTAQFKTVGLPASAHFRLRYSIDGVTRTSGPLTWGAGTAGTGNWIGILGNWLVKPGQHVAKVELDATNTVAETTNADNVKSFGFTPVTFQSGYVPGQKFITPLGGTPNVHWKIEHYVDLDTREGFKRDYFGRVGDAAETYDGHNGMDFSAVGFSTQYVGLPILAAADGVVTQIADGNFDEYDEAMGADAEGGHWGNFVTIKHGNGWETNYIHLRKNSVSVSVGDYVRAGDVLGMMASSGNSTGTHLHFRVAHNGLLVEPYVSPGGYWYTPLPYAGNAPYKNPALSTYTSPHTTENVGMAKIPISRMSPFGTETVNWSTQGLTAKAGIDYTASSGTLVFDNLEFTKYIFVPIADDGLHEASETFRINLSNGDGDTWSRDVRLVDNDALLHYNAASDTLTVTGDTGQVNDVITLDVVSGKIKVTVNNETRYFPVNGPAGPVAKVVVNAGDGNDTINVLATATGVKTTVNAGTGTDTINVGEPGELFDAMYSLDRIKGEVAVNGGTGNNTLNLKDNSISGLARAYTITAVYVSRTGVKYSYDLVQSLTLTAGGGGDLFVVQSTNASTPVAIHAGGGTDTVVGPTSTNLWSITGANKGTLNSGAVSFTAVERLNGGTGADTFSFTPGGVVDQANGAGGSDTLVGPNFNTTWSLTAMNGGGLTWQPSRLAAKRAVAFSSVENLTGGSATDTFKLSNGKGVSGAIDGGGGVADHLNYELYTTAVTVNLGAGVATRTGAGVTRIEHVTGGSADDTLIGDGANNLLRGGTGGNDVLVGGTGADTLLGFAGRDILIGGTGIDKIDGAGGDDILIDGTTDLDADIAALTALRTAWTSAQNYNQRVQSLSGTLSPASVQHDASPDTLTGGLDRDWFWADGLDTTDAVPLGNQKEQVN